MFSRTIYQGSLTIWLLLLFGNCSIKCSIKAAPKDSSKRLKIGFWNLENLYDTQNDPYNDDDFTPEGIYAWDGVRYNNKLQNVRKVIDSINADVLGLCEVENETVLKNLCEKLRESGKKYDIIHFDSPDERGIDAALLYNPEKVATVLAVPIPVQLGDKDKTRDILYVKFVHRFTRDTLHYFVNHWPSRRGGQKESAGKRAKAAQTLADYLSINKLSNKSLILVGDFNDNPWDSSIQKVLGTCKPEENADCDLFNLSLLHNNAEKGTLWFGNSWDIFDQIIFSKSLWEGKKSKLKYTPLSNNIYAPDWMLQQEGKFKGHPLRTFGGKVYLNGYSDHLPVIAELHYD